MGQVSPRAPGLILLAFALGFAGCADADAEDSHVRTVADTRVPPPGTGELVEIVHVADPNARTLAWTLELHRLPRSRARERGLTDAQNIVEVARGELTLR